MSGAEPWIGSNIDGKVLSGLILPLGPTPRLPEIAEPISVKMSPNKFEVTMTSRVCGLVIIRAANASTWYFCSFTSGYSIETFESVLEGLNLKLFFAELNEVNGGSIRLFVCRKDNNIYNKEKFTDQLKKLKIEEQQYNLKAEKTFKEFQNKIDNIKKKLIYLLIIY